MLREQRDGHQHSEHEPLYLRDFCRAQHDWLLETIETLVRLESPTTDKTAVDRCGAELKARLTAIGGRVTALPRTDRGDHLIAEFWLRNLADPAARALRYGVAGRPARPHAAHSNERAAPRSRRVRHEGGYRARHACARALIETGAPLSHRIVMLWTSDEEVGSATSRAAIEEEARRSNAVLVLEPSLPGGALKTSRKAVRRLSEVIVRGVAAHAGIEPQKGASAMQRARAPDSAYQRRARIWIVESRSM